ncbi:MAG: hypothetical protein AB2L20_07535 [Mangrovibacterium sp.]
MRMILFLRIGLLLAALSLPSSLPAQTVSEEPVDENLQKAIDWAEGGQLFDDWFMDAFLTGWKEVIWGEFDTFIDLARVLAGLMALLAFAGRSYGMMTGEQKWDILPLLRPFGLLMIILYWGPFVQIVSFPTDIMANAMRGKQETQQITVNQLRYIRKDYQYNMIENLYDYSAQTEAAAEQSKSFLEDPLGSMGRSIKQGVQSVVYPVLELKEKLRVGIQLTVTQLLETLALWILRLAVYVIFAIQIIYSGILIMMGPLSVAMSILPMFRDSFATWIARFISVNLYTTIALIILFVGGIFQEFAMESEIARYAEIVNRDGTLVSIEKLMFLKMNGMLSFGVVILSFLMTAICMMTVPSISTWIVSTSGVSSAVSTMGRSAPIIFGGGKKVATTMVKMGTGKIV